MASKKCKGKIIFSGNRLKLMINSNSNINPRALPKNGEKIILESWTDNDIYFGKNKSVVHIDYITLELISHPSYSFESHLSNSSFYTIGFQKISEFESFSCIYQNNEIVLNGEISFNIGIKDIVYNDFKNSGLVLFGEIGVRVEKDILVFDKYGLDWDKRSSDRDNYSKEANPTFSINRPIVKLK
jgi:hypothetical protein